MKNLLRRFTSLPFKLHGFFVLFLVFVLPWLTRNTKNPGEWFPFSNFPMYSNFEETAYYVYITDLNDQPLGTVPLLGMTPSGIKKSYDQKLKSLVTELKKNASARGEKYRKRLVQMEGEECRPAGDAALAQLMDSAADKATLNTHKGFRLYQTDITLVDGLISKRTKLVGEVRN